MWRKLVQRENCGIVLGEPKTCLLCVLNTVLREQALISKWSLLLRILGNGKGFCVE
ncbi:unnamed protein product [Tenebrio molitor]|nr:unnamed protein product [Tenebrio molitor]